MTDPTTPTDAGRDGGPLPVLALAVLALAVGATFLPWPTATGRPEGWSLVALGLVAVTMAAVVARRGAPAPWTATGAVLAALLVVGRGATAFGELAHDRVGAEPGPALLLVAALVGVAVGASTLGSTRPGPARRRAALVAAGLVGLAAAVTGGRFALATSSGAEPAFVPGSLLADATGQGSVRPATVVRGELVAVAGTRVMVEVTGVGGPRFEVHDGRTGRPVWSATGPGHAPIVRATADQEGFVVLTDRGPVRYDAGTGAVQWRTDLGGGGGLAVVADGIATLVGADTERAAVVLDPTTGAERRRVRLPCGNAELVDVRVLTVRCGPVERSSRVAVFGGPGAEATYAGFGVVGEKGVVDAGPGLLAVGDTTAERSIVDAATGAVRFAVPAGAVVLDSPDPATVVLLTGTDTDRLERRDAATGGLQGAVTLDGGSELDARPDRRAVRVLRDGRLVQGSPGGLGTARSPAGERRLGLVAWDLATGARVERTVNGPVASASRSVRVTRLVLGRDLVATGVVPDVRAGSWVVVYTVERA